jgi:hypothetical protein
MQISHANNSAATRPLFSLLRSIVWILLFVTAALSYADPDLWGHVRFGQDMLTTGTLPSVDPYSFTQDRPWVNHEWLSEWTMAVFYEGGGVVGLVVLKLCIVGAAFLVIFRSLSATLNFRMHIAAFLLVVWGAFPLTTTIRPQLWTFLGLALVTTILTTDRRKWLLPAIFCVWANMHGGWLVGLGVLWLWSLGELRDKPRVMHLAVPTAATAATLVNPYGWNLWWFIADTVRLGRQGISEWQPLWLSPVAEWPPWLITVGVVAWVWPRRVGTWLIAVTLGIAAAKVSRLMPLFVEVTVLLLAADRIWLEVPVVAKGPLARGPRIINGIAVSLIAAAAFMKTLPHFTCLPIEPQWAADPGVVEGFARQNGRLAVEFNWGEYAIWHLGPEVRVSIDGRRETIYSHATLDTQRSLALGERKGLEWLSMAKPEYLWFAASRGALKSAVQRLGYRLDVDTSHSFLAVRADLPPIQRRPVASTRICFP